MEILVLLTTFLLCWRLICSVEKIKLSQMEEDTNRLELRLDSERKFLEQSKEAE